MLQVVGRDQFLALVGVKPATWDYRIHTGEAALALGVRKPPHIGEYLILDATATILASMLNCFCGLTLRQAADEVRTHWDGWLTLLTRAERWAERSKDDPLLYFAVVRTSLDPRRYRIVCGNTAEIAAAVAGQTVAPCFASMHLVLRALRANAKNAGIKLPPRLTVAKGEPGYRERRRDIDAYRQAAGARAAKTKPKTLVKA
jgi:hypothetical protein